MKTTTTLTALITLAATAALAADPIIVDIDALPDEGIQVPRNGAVWDFNTTVNWTTDDGITRTPWTDNNNIARFQLQTLPDWADMVVYVTNTYGQVGTHQLLMTGTLPGSKKAIFRGDPLYIGAGGVYFGSADTSTQLFLTNGTVATSSQTWQYALPSALNGAALMTIFSLTNAPGIQTDLTFDGLSMADAGNAANTARRPQFYITGSGVWDGDTTIKNGGCLKFSITANDNRPTLFPTRNLILQGGCLHMHFANDSIRSTQHVANIYIEKGANMLWGVGAGNINNFYVCQQIERRGIGGTFNTPVYWGALDLYTETANINGILGGWCTSSQGGFATVAAHANAPAGTMRVGGTTGTAKTVDTWQTAVNINANSGGTRTAGDCTINALLISTNELINLDTATLTLRSGGLILNTPAINGILTGGSICTLFSTGELFLHALANYTIGSTIVDNGDTPCTLVKAGPFNLTLTAANTYTGDTYLNSGTLTYSDNAALTGNIIQAGGTTLALADGGTYQPPVPTELYGNLHIGNGAQLNLAAGVTSKTITLANRFATLTGPASAEGATIDLTASDISTRGKYPIISWVDDVTLNQFDAAKFKVVLDSRIIGNLEVEDNALVLNVTEVILPTNIFLY